MGAIACAMLINCSVQVQALHPGFAVGSSASACGMSPVLVQETLGIKLLDAPQLKLSQYVLAFPDPLCAPQLALTD